MITVVPYAGLGHADHGWLDARHHFSFANYYNPARMGFGPLRVVNDDRIAGGRGFGAHPHDNMEIITYVRQGAITHKDNLGNTGRTGAGDVQVMSAGTGVTHAEYNLEEEDTRLYQIWIEPNRENVAPRWDARAFPKAPVTDSLPVLVSGRPTDSAAQPLAIHADAAIRGGRLTAGTALTQPLSGEAYILASDGTVTINGTRLAKGDGAEVSGETALSITADTDAELLIIELPAAA